jgi:hypothetical protein
MYNVRLRIIYIYIYDSHSTQSIVLDCHVNPEKIQRLLDWSISRINSFKIFVIIKKFKFNWDNCFVQLVSLHDYNAEIHNFYKYILIYIIIVEWVHERQKKII